MKKEIIKSFDLEAYKKGVNVKTRDGHEVRIVCTDAKGSCFPLIALIKIDDAHEVTMHYTYEGKINAGAISDNDLVIVEEVEEPEFWSDKECKVADGYFIDFDSSIAYCSYTQYNQNHYKNFASTKQAKSALAMAMISQIMANDIEHFGGVVTDEEWENDEWKFVIYRMRNNIKTISAKSDYYFLAFHTAAQRDLFLEKYERLVRDYLCLD